MQNDDPIVALFDTIRGINQSRKTFVIGIGKVTSEKPLKIMYNGIELDEKDLWVNDYLKIGHYRTAKGRIISGTKEAGHHVHKHTINNPYKETYYTTNTDLPIGSYVALAPIMSSTDQTRQQFIVLCHIYRPDGKYYS